jgi:hypothetical protein
LLLEHTAFRTQWIKQQRWLMPIILATLEVEIKKIKVPGQL